MLFTDLLNVPVKVTQVTPNMYSSGEDGAVDPGASLSVKVTVEDGAIQLESHNGRQATLWHETDDTVSLFAKVMNGGDHPIELDDGEALAITVKDSNGVPIFSTQRGHKLTVTNGARPSLSATTLRRCSQRSSA